MTRSRKKGKLEFYGNRTQIAATNKQKIVVEPPLLNKRASTLYTYALFAQQHGRVLRGIELERAAVQKPSEN